MAESTCTAGGRGDLSGRVAVVTGATGSIGRRISHMLAERGAKVAVLYGSRADAADALVAELPGEGHVTARLDLADPGSIQATIGDVVGRCGPVGILIHSAHLDAEEPYPVAAADLPALALELRTAESYAALCSAVAPGMREAGWGRVVLISGALMTRPAPGRGSYAAAKSASAALTRYLALEEGRNGITANIVAPGRVISDAGEEEPPPQFAELSRKLKERMALPSFPTHSQVADAVRLLIEAEYLTAQTLWVTGGEPIAS